MRKNNPAVNWIWTAVLMMALWFVMSEKTEPKFLILGVASSILVACVCLRTLTMRGQRSGRDYYLLMVNVPRFIGYFAWLLWQIAKSALYVSRISLFHTDKVQPQIVWFRADYDHPAASAMLANSITLTPGTVTIDITEEGLYSVHALTAELRDGLLDGSMQNKVAWLYGETINFAVISEEEAVRSAAHMPAGHTALARRRYSAGRKKL